MPKRVIVFDVNETLLDLRALKPQFERVFGDGDVLYQWFGQVLQSALLTRGDRTLRATSARSDGRRWRWWRRGAA